MMIAHRVDSVSPADTATVSRDIESLALTYGVEARRHYGDCSWDDVCVHLAAGWPRLCAARGPGWEAVAGLVRSGWLSAHAHQPA